MSIPIQTPSASSSSGSDTGLGAYQRTLANTRAPDAVIPLSDALSHNTDLAAQIQRAVMTNAAITSIGVVKSDSQPLQIFDSDPKQALEAQARQDALLKLPELHHQAIQEETTKAVAVLMKGQELSPQEHAELKAGLAEKMGDKLAANTPQGQSHEGDAASVFTPAMPKDILSRFI